MSNLISIFGFIRNRFKKFDIKSIHLLFFNRNFKQLNKNVYSIQSKVSALEELDKCIAEFDTYSVSGGNAMNMTQHHDLSSSRSITGVTDLSTSQLGATLALLRQQQQQQQSTNQLSISSFSMMDEASTNKIMESTGTSSSGCSGGANLSSIVSLSRDDADAEVDADSSSAANKSRLAAATSPDLNNNSNMADANAGSVPGPKLFSASSLMKVKSSKGDTTIPTPPPAPVLPSRMSVSLKQNNEYKNFMRKPVNR